MKKKINKNTVLRIIQAIFGAAAVFFIVWYFIKNKDDFAKIQGLDPVIFVVSALLFMIYTVLLASLWHYLTVINGCSVKYEKAVTSYLLSIPGKYIPGKVFMLAARLTYYKEDNAPLSKVTVCFFLENICTLLGAAMLFIVSLLFFPNDLLENYRWAVIGLIVVFFVCIHPAVINFALGLLGKLFKKDLKIPMKYPQMLKAVLLFICNCLVAGAGFFMLARSVYPDIGAEHLLYCAGVWGISTIMGILAIFAPSGIGVKEGIMVWGLSLIMPTEYAVLISVAARLWQTVCEIILVAGAFIYSRIRKLNAISYRRAAEESRNAEENNNE